MEDHACNSAHEVSGGTFTKTAPGGKPASQALIKAALIGGGKECNDFLAMAKTNGLLQLNMEIVGVADPDPESREIALAGEMGLFTTADFTDLYSLPELTLLIAFTNSRKICERVIRTKPEHVGFMDPLGAELLWNLIRASEHKLHLFLESARDVICIKDLEGHYLYLNSAASDLMEIDRDEILGKNDHELFPEPIARAITEHDRQALALGSTMFFYERMCVKDRVRHYHTLRFPILNDSGKMISFAIVSRDMTESVVLLDEIRQHKEYMENILANSSDMIVTTDLEGRTVTFNPAAEKMLGYRRNEVIGANIESLWKDPEERRKLMEEVKRRGSVSNYPATLTARDGHEVEVSLSLSELRDSAGYLLGTVGISKDVTEENRLRRRILQHDAEVASVGIFADNSEKKDVKPGN